MKYFGMLGDVRAMTADEILAMQAQQMAAMQQAYAPFDLWKMIAQYRPPERPLDERFADFKIRLAAAVKRHRSSA